MKKFIHSLSRAVQLVLAAPVKLPAKMLQVVRYIALGLGILETVVPDQDTPQETTSGEEGNQRPIEEVRDE